MSLLTPERSTSPQPACDRPVSGDGLVSYHCSLPQGHTIVNPEDPEPCFAVESTRSARMWDTWKRRQIARAEPPTVTIECPACKQVAMKVSLDNIGRCESCGVEAGMQIEEPIPARDDSDIQQAATRAVFEASHGEMAARVLDPGETDEEALERGVDPERHRLAVCQLVTCTATEVHGHNDGGWDLLPRSTIDHTLADEACMMRPEHVEMDTDPEARCDICRTSVPGFVPTEEIDRGMRVEAQRASMSTLRTRPGDQRLPDGDESIPDDQSLLIADIEERRQVGIGRYGQGHRPFNGRDTLMDLYQEQLDLLVYLRSIVRMADATREDLVDVVANSLVETWMERTKEQTSATPAEHCLALAEVAVDRIMGWVGADIIEANPQHEES